MRVRLLYIFLALSATLPEDGFLVTHSIALLLKAEIGCITVHQRKESNGLST